MIKTLITPLLSIQSCNKFPYQLFVDALQSRIKCYLLWYAGKWVFYFTLLRFAEALNVVSDQASFLNYRRIDIITQVGGD